MTYAAVDSIVQSTRAAGDIRGQVNVALIKKAAVRVNLIGATDKQEASICREVLDATMPVSWTTMVLEVLDLNGALGTHTDTQVDAAVDTAWTYFMASRTLA